ncbi:MAG: PIN domain-containing protein [Blautia sp.]|nr:PIN domain-containing protein [Blautia sp.]
MRVLLDTNVIVDVLQRREPWFSDGQKIFYAVANKQIAGCITAKEAADIYFFSRKQFTGEENVDAKARQVLSKLYALFELIDTLGIDCQNALAIENNDYEDAIMIESAARVRLDGIITRNPEHFKPSSVPVYSPSEFVAKLKEHQE